MKLKSLIYLTLIIGLGFTACKEPVEPEPEKPDYGNVVADFVAKSFDGEVITSIDMGEIVTFLDMSEGRPDERQWTLEGAVPVESDRMRISVRYPKPGKYPVKLMVTRTSDGETDEVTVPNYMTINSIPVEAKFVTDVAPTDGVIVIKTGDYVTFSDVSAGVPEISEWEFQGGKPGTSSEKSPVVRYETAGIYDVKLKASRNDNGTIVEDEIVETGIIKVEQRVISLKKLTYDDKTIEVWFNDQLMPDPSGAASDFSVNINTAASGDISATVTQVQLDPNDNKKLILTIDQPTYDDDIVTLKLVNTGNLLDATMLTNVSDFEANCIGTYENLWSNDVSFENKSWWLKHGADANGMNGWSWYEGDIQYDGNVCVKYTAEPGVVKKQMLSPVFVDPIPAGDYVLYCRVFIESGSIDGVQWTVRSPWLGNKDLKGWETFPNGAWVEAKLRLNVKADVGTANKNDFFITTLNSADGVVMYIDDMGMFNTNLRP